MANFGYAHDILRVPSSFQGPDFAQKFKTLTELPTDKFEREKRLEARKGVTLAFEKAKKHFNETGRKLIWCLGGGTNIWDHYIDEISRTEGIKKYVEFVASSDESTKRMEARGFDCPGFETLKKSGKMIDFLTDGADEITQDGIAIKGGGGCEKREKEAIAIAKEIWIGAESKKLVEKLGAFPVPFDIDEKKLEEVEEILKGLGARSFKIKMISGKDVEFRPDGGPRRLIVFADFSGADLPVLAAEFERLKNEGLFVEHGVCFFNKAPEKILIGQDFSVLEIEPLNSIARLHTANDYEATDVNLNNLAPNHNI